MDDNRFRILTDENNLGADTLKFTLNKLSSPTRTNIYKIPIFFNHIKKNNINSVVEFLEYIPANSVYKKNTALNYAIYFKRIDIIKLLLQKGADPTIKSEMYNMDAFDEARSDSVILDILKDYKKN